VKTETIPISDRPRYASCATDRMRILQETNRPEPKAESTEHTEGFEQEETEKTEGGQRPADGGVGFCHRAHGGRTQRKPETGGGSEGGKREGGGWSEGGRPLRGRRIGGRRVTR
jgi:hypothetical protein